MCMPPPDPREQAVLPAIDANNRERAEARALRARDLPPIPYPVVTARTLELEGEMVIAIETIRCYVAKFGAKRVNRWVLNVASQMGQKV